MGKSITKRLTFIAVLTAIAALFNIFSISTGVNGIMVSFVYIPCMIAGLWLGPIDGFAVGFLGDLLGCIIHPMGPYMPLVGIASGCFGLVPGLVRYLPVKDYWKIIISMSICLVVCTCGLNTLALWLVYGMGKKTFFAYLIVRLPWQALVASLNCVLMICLYPLFVRAMDRAGYNTGRHKKTVIKAVEPNTEEA